MIKIVTSIIGLMAITLSISSYGQDFYRYPEYFDSTIMISQGDLINTVPTKKTIETYFVLAQTLWEFERIDESKEMFLKIVNSDEPKYRKQNHVSSDIKGDTSENIYGYGSFTWNYKNSSSLYLSKIFIEQKNYKDAFIYLTAADKKYPVNHNCGTGQHMYQTELRQLYGLCYEGLNETEKAIDLLLPYYSDMDNEILIRVLEKIYSPEELKSQLDKSINSITCEVDSSESKAFITKNYGLENEETTELTYYSGTGKIELFGRTIIMPSPVLKTGEILSTEYLTEEFKSTFFYQLLSGDYSKSPMQFDIPKITIDQK